MDLISFFQYPAPWPAWLPYALGGTALILSLITLFYLLRPLLRVGSFRAVEAAIPEGTPKVSVIVQTLDTDEAIAPFLDALTAQDYPDFEVILVCETTCDSREVLLEWVSRRYSNVYATFIPPEAHHLSKRKLSLTLGIKAAKGEIVVTTVSNATIPSPQWLRELVAPICNSPATDVALGYSALNYAEMRGWGRWYREFNSLLTNASWLGRAIGGDPFRGDGYNLAFRRHIFFDHKGYAKSIFMHCGDDDLFINEIADGTNTAVVLSPLSNLKINWGDASKRIWRARKDQYNFTSRWLPRAPFTISGWLSAMQWLVSIAAIGAILTGIGAIPALTEGIIPVAMGAFILIAFWQTEILIYRRAAKKMQATRLWWALPLFMLLRAPLNTLFKLRHHRSSRRNFTWERRR